MFRCFSLKSISVKPSISSSSSAPNLRQINSSTNSTSNSTHHNHNSRNDDAHNEGEDEGNSSPEQDPLSPNLLYSLVVQSNSYTEIRDRVQTHHNQLVVVSPLLRPNRTTVEESLRLAPPNKLTHLLTSYFKHFELAFQFLYSLLDHSLPSVRSLYSPLHDFLNEFNAETQPLSPPQCHHIIQLFNNFLLFPDPFNLPSSATDVTATATFLDVHRSFSELKLQHDRRLRRAQSLTTFPGSAIKGSALCIWSAFKGPAHFTFPSKFVKKQLEHIAQLDAAAIGAYVVNRELETINCLVKRLQNVVECDRDSVKFGWEKGRDDDNGNHNRYLIQEVMKQLKDNRVKLEKQMEDLEEHVLICLTYVNKARARLLDKIQRQ